MFECNLVERTQDRGGKISSQSSAPGVLTTRAKVCDPPPRGQGRGDCLVPVEPPGRRKGCPEVSLTLRTPQVLQHPVPCQRTTGARSSVRAPRITPSLLPAPRVSVPSPVPPSAARSGRLRHRDRGAPAVLVGREVVWHRCLSHPEQKHNQETELLGTLTHRTGLGTQAAFL